MADILKLSNEHRKESGMARTKKKLQDEQRLELERILAAQRRKSGRGRGRPRVAGRGGGPHGHRVTYPATVTQSVPSTSFSEPSPVAPQLSVPELVSATSLPSHATLPSTGLSSLLSSFDSPHVSPVSSDGESPCKTSPAVPSRNNKPTARKSTTAWNRSHVSSTVDSTSSAGVLHTDFPSQSTSGIASATDMGNIFDIMMGTSVLDNDEDKATYRESPVKGDGQSLNVFSSVTQAIHNLGVGAQTPIVCMRDIFRGSPTAFNGANITNSSMQTKSSSQTNQSTNNTHIRHTGKENFSQCQTIACGATVNFRQNVLSKIDSVCSKVSKTQLFKADQHYPKALLSQSVSTGIPKKGQVSEVNSQTGVPGDAGPACKCSAGKSPSPSKGLTVPVSPGRSTEKRKRSPNVRLGSDMILLPWHSSRKPRERPTEIKTEKKSPKDMPRVSPNVSTSDDSTCNTHNICSLLPTKKLSPKSESLHPCPSLLTPTYSEFVENITKVKVGESDEECKEMEVKFGIAEASSTPAVLEKQCDVNIQCPAAGDRSMEYIDGTPDHQKLPAKRKVDFDLEQSSEISEYLTETSTEPEHSYHDLPKIEENLCLPSTSALSYCDMPLDEIQSCESHTLADCTDYNKQFGDTLTECKPGASRLLNLIDRMTARVGTASEVEDPASSSPFRDEESEELVLSLSVSPDESAEEEESPEPRPSTSTAEADSELQEHQPSELEKLLSDDRATTGGIIKAEAEEKPASQPEGVDLHGDLTGPTTDKTDTAPGDNEALRSCVKAELEQPYSTEIEDSLKIEQSTENSTGNLRDVEAVKESGVCERTVQFLDNYELDIKDKSLVTSKSVELEFSPDVSDNLGGGREGEAGVNADEDLSYGRRTREPAPLSVLSTVESLGSPKVLSAFMSENLDSYLESDQNRMICLSSTGNTVVSNRDEKKFRAAKNQPQTSPTSPNNTVEKTSSRNNPDFDDVEGMLFVSFDCEEAMEAHIRIEKHNYFHDSNYHFLDMCKLHKAANIKKRLGISGKLPKFFREKEQNFRGIHMKWFKYLRLFYKEMSKITGTQLKFETNLAKSLEKTNDITKIKFETNLAKNLEKTNDITKIKGWKTKYVEPECKSPDEGTETLDRVSVQQPGKLHWRTEQRLLKSLDPEDIREMGLELKKKTKIKGWKNKYVEPECKSPDEGTETLDKVSVQQPGKLHWRTEQRLLRSLAPEDIREMGLELKKKRRKSLIFTHRKISTKFEGRVGRFGRVRKPRFGQDDEYYYGDEEKYYEDDGMVKVKVKTEKTATVTETANSNTTEVVKKKPSLKKKLMKKYNLCGLKRLRKMWKRRVREGKLAASKKELEAVELEVGFPVLTARMALRAVSALDLDMLGSPSRDPAEAFPMDSVTLAGHAKTEVMDATDSYDDLSGAGLSEEGSGPNRDMDQSLCGKPGCRYGCVCHLFRDRSVLGSKGSDSDEVVKEASPHICEKEYCRLGCICSSLDRQVAERDTHCGKADCIFGCQCDARETTLGLLMSPGRDASDDIPLLHAVTESLKSPDSGGSMKSPEPISAEAAPSQTPFPEVPEVAKKSQPPSRNKFANLPKRVGSQRVAKNLDAITRKALMYMDPDDLLPKPKRKRRRNKKEEAVEGYKELGSTTLSWPNTPDMTSAQATTFEKVNNRTDDEIDALSDDSTEIFPLPPNFGCSRTSIFNPTRKQRVHGIVEHKIEKTVVVDVESSRTPVKDKDSQGQSSTTSVCERQDPLPETMTREQPYNTVGKCQQVQDSMVMNEDSVITDKSVKENVIVSDPVKDGVINISDDDGDCVIEKETSSKMTAADVPSRPSVDTMRRKKRKRKQRLEKTLLDSNRSPEKRLTLSSESSSETENKIAVSDTWSVHMVCLKATKKRKTTPIDETNRTDSENHLLEIKSNCKWEYCRTKVLSSVARCLRPFEYPSPQELQVQHFTVEILPKASEPAKIPAGFQVNFPSVMYPVRVTVAPTWFHKQNKASDPSPPDCEMTASKQLSLRLQQQQKAAQQQQKLQQQQPPPQKQPQQQQQPPQQQPPPPVEIGNPPDRTHSVNSQGEKTVKSSSQCFQPPSGISGLGKLNINKSFIPLSPGVSQQSSVFQLREGQITFRSSLPLGKQLDKERNITGGASDELPTSMTSSCAGQSFTSTSNSAPSITTSAGSSSLLSGLQDGTLPLTRLSTSVAISSLPHSLSTSNAAVTSTPSSVTTTTTSASTASPLTPTSRAGPLPTMQLIKDKSGVSKLVPIPAHKLSGMPIVQLLPLNTAIRPQKTGAGAGAPGQPRAALGNAVIPLNKNYVAFPVYLSPVNPNRQPTPQSQNPTTGPSLRASTLLTSGVPPTGTTFTPVKLNAQTQPTTVMSAPAKSGQSVMHLSTGTAVPSRQESRHSLSSLLADHVSPGGTSDTAAVTPLELPVQTPSISKPPQPPQSTVTLPAVVCGGGGGGGDISVDKPGDNSDVIYQPHVSAQEVRSAPMTSSGGVGVNSSAEEKSIASVVQKSTEEKSEVTETTSNNVDMSLPAVVQETQQSVTVPVTTTSEKSAHTCVTESTILVAGDNVDKSVPAVEQVTSQATTPVTTTLEKSEDIIEPRVSVAGNDVDKTVLTLLQEMTESVAPMTTTSEMSEGITEPRISVAGDNVDKSVPAVVQVTPQAPTLLTTTSENSEGIAESCADNADKSEPAVVQEPIQSTALMTPNSEHLISFSEPGISDTKCDPVGAQEAINSLPISNTDAGKCSGASRLLVAEKPFQHVIKEQNVTKAPTLPETSQHTVTPEVESSQDSWSDYSDEGATSQDSRIVLDSSSDNEQARQSDEDGFVDIEGFSGDEEQTKSRPRRKSPVKPINANLDITFTEGVVLMPAVMKKTKEVEEDVKRPLHSHRERQRRKEDTKAFHRMRVVLAHPKPVDESERKPKVQVLTEACAVIELLKEEEEALKMELKAEHHRWRYLKQLLPNSSGMEPVTLAEDDRVMDLGREETDIRQRPDSRLSSDSGRSRHKVVESLTLEDGSSLQILLSEGESDSEEDSRELTSNIPEETDESPTSVNECIIYHCSVTEPDSSVDTCTQVQAASGTGETEQGSDQGNILQNLLHTTKSVTDVYNSIKDSPRQNPQTAASGLDSIEILNVEGSEQQPVVLKPVGAHTTQHVPKIASITTVAERCVNVRDGPPKRTHPSAPSVQSPLKKLRVQDPVVVSSIDDDVKVSGVEEQVPSIISSVTDNLRRSIVQDPAVMSSVADGEKPLQVQSPVVRPSIASSEELSRVSSSFTNSASDNVPHQGIQITKVTSYQSRPKKGILDLEAVFAKVLQAGELETAEPSAIPPVVIDGLGGDGVTYCVESSMTEDISSKTLPESIRSESVLKDQENGVMFELGSGDSPCELSTEAEDTSVQPDTGNLMILDVCSLADWSAV